MSSINLSFREWPFSPTKRNSSISQLKSSLSNSTSEINNNQSSNLTSKSSSTTQTIESTKTIENKSSDYHLSSWGRCGLFACTNDSCLSIFSRDSHQNLSQIFMFSPFEVLTVGRINNQPQKTAFLTAIAWSDGHLEPSIPSSLLAASSEKGHLVIYDFDTKENIADYRFNEPIVSILWSSFKQSRFYVGSKNGHFYVCELFDRKRIEIVKVFDFAIKSSNLPFDNVYKSVDFITQDDVNGYTVGIASKDQQFGIITNVNDDEKMDLQLFKNTEMCEKINFFQFYPNSKDFITFATDSSSYFLSISKGTLVPFIQTTNCKFISFIDSENDKVIVGNENEIAVWQLVNKLWVRLYNLSIGSKEILTFSKHNDKILLTTASNFLTEVEFKSFKLFITRRVKLIDGSIVDYDFYNGSIAFLTSNNSIALTDKTPESIVKQSFSEKHKHDEKSDESSQQYSSSNDEDDGPMNNNLREENINSLRLCKSEESDSELINSKCKIDESIRGNSNTLVLSFKIENGAEFDLKHIKWISPDKIIAWCKYSLYLIDLKSRSITEPFAKKFCKKSVQITQVFFSKSRRYIGIVIDHIKAYFLDTKSNLDIIKFIDFSDNIIDETDYLLGYISPNEDMAVFTLSNYVFFIHLNEKESSTKKIKSIVEFQASFLSWENSGIYIGTEKGGALLIPDEKINSVYERSQFGKKFVNIIFNSIDSDKQKLEAIKQILPCSNKRYIIIDSSHKGFLISKNVKMIADNIKTFKQTSEDNFLVRLQNYNRLAAINSYSELISSLPPCFYSSQEKKNNFIQEIKNNNINNDSNLNEYISDQIFLTNKTNFATTLRNNVQLLNDLISNHDPFNSVSSKAFLKLGNLEEARKMCLKSNPNDKDYFNNIMLAAVYKSNADSAKLIVNNFLTNNLIDEAVNVLLMTKEIFLAAEVLSKNGRNEDAYRVLMLNDQKKDGDNAEKIVLKVADSLINNKENVLLGLKLLSSFGYNKEMLNHLSLIF